MVRRGTRAKSRPIYAARFYAHGVLQLLTLAVLWPCYSETSNEIEHPIYLAEELLLCVYGRDLICERHAEIFTSLNIVVFLNRVIWLYTFGIFETIRYSDSPNIGPKFLSLLGITCILKAYWHWHWRKVRENSLRQPSVTENTSATFQNASNLVHDWRDERRSPCCSNSSSSVYG